MTVTFFTNLTNYYKDISEKHRILQKQFLLDFAQEEYNENELQANPGSTISLKTERFCQNLSNCECIIIAIIKFLLPIVESRIYNHIFSKCFCITKYNIENKNENITQARIICQIFSFSFSKNLG